MIKRLVVVSTLLLASCGPTTPSIDTAALQIVIGKVVGFTKQICSFVPTNASVTAIIVAMGPEAASAFGIATSICQAVTASTTTPPGPALFKDEAGSCPMVEGVCVEGEFVPKDESKPEEEAH